MATDIHNLTTSSQYDGFGRMIKTIFPDGNKSLSSIHWDQLNPEGNILYYTEIITDGAPTQRNYYDILGRKVIGGYEDLNSNMVFSKTVYNSNGQVESVTEPYYEGGSPLFLTDYFYDELSRPTQIQYPTNTVGYQLAQV